MFDEVQERRARGAAAAFAEERIASSRKPAWSICRDARVELLRRTNDGFSALFHACQLACDCAWE